MLLVLAKNIVHQFFLLITENYTGTRSRKTTKEFVGVEHESIH